MDQSKEDGICVWSETQILQWIVCVLTVVADVCTVIMSIRTIVPEYVLHVDSAISLPKDVTTMIHDARRNGFTFGIEGDNWDWCVSDIRCDVLHPSFVNVCYRSRGAWDEMQEILYDTDTKVYVLSIRGYNDAFSPDTIVNRSDMLCKLISNTESVGIWAAHRVALLYICYKFVNF